MALSNILRFFVNAVIVIFQELCIAVANAAEIIYDSDPVLPTTAVDLVKKDGPLLSMASFVDVLEKCSRKFINLSSSFAFFKYTTIRAQEEMSSELATLRGECVTHVEAAEYLDAFRKASAELASSIDDNRDLFVVVREEVSL